MELLRFGVRFLFLAVRISLINDVSMFFSELSTLVLRNVFSTSAYCRDGVCRDGVHSVSTG